MRKYGVVVLTVLSILVIAEILWSWKKEKRVYNVKETLANILIFIGFQISKLVFTGYQLALLGFVSGFAIVSIKNSTVSFICCFVLADFIYYWFHRISHSWKPLWAFHLVHHSSQWMNLTAAYRLNWFNALVSPLFFIPLTLIGFSPSFIVIAYTLNLFYQFFLHTEMIGKLGPIEGLLDTPSSHRVHHGSNSIYIDKNFGGVFMIWDRLFHTYQPETEKVQYGITSGFISYNPLILIFKGFIDFFTGKMKYKG